MNKCSAIAEQLPQQPEIKTKQKFNHNVNMHSLSLLRIDYYGIVYRELFAVSIRARLCVAFMWPTCFAIRYDVCRVFHMKTWRIFFPFHSKSSGRYMVAYFSGCCVCVLSACLKIVIIQQNYKFFAYQCRFILSYFFSLPHSNSCFVFFCVHICRIFFAVIFIVSSNFHKENHL